ncbi:RHS repeat-associated core domain-containing protein [Roseateles sp.]|uniref:RHS repeat-associated core domain-containing protein n=1 Tax=Roseateles sp. TaxID=1971397 RepID=UPI00326536AB
MEVSVYEEHRLIAQADAAGHAQRAYVYLGLRPVAQLDLAPQGGWAGLLATWRGAPVLQLHTDPAGRVVSASRDGQALAAASQPLRDVGQRHDDDTGLAYHGARFLNPRTGRFLSPDPQGIADAVRGVTRAHLLDTYAYAGGRPDLYIDPDGAARIRYFAITTGANGRALGDNQGFTKGRWAFIIDQVGAGGDASTALGRKRNEYAANGTGLLFDKDGDFLTASKSSETWTGGSAGVPDLFTDHYGNHRISVPAFTITNFDDDRAASVIASLIPADRATVFPGACPAYSLLLPPIHFAAEQTDIDVTRTDPARKQRILACGAGSAASLEQRRISTYEAAAELNETGRPKRINKDCSADGCPGVYYSCNATRCVGTNGAPAGGGTSYVASYGRSQFIGATLVSELVNAYATFTAAERTQLGMGPTSLADLNAADTRGRNLLRWFNTQIAAAPTYAAAGTAWDNLPAPRRALFTAETGLGERGYEDIVRLKTSPPTNSNGTSLLGDARQAMVTAAILSDATMNTLLMGIFQDFDRFTVMGRKLMQNNLTRVLARYPTADDEEVAARVARLHNGGNWQAPLATLKGAGDSFNYVKRFLGDIHGEGEWRSLRCVEDFGTGVTTVAPGTAGSGVGGLEMKTLTIP